MKLFSLFNIIPQFYLLCLSLFCLSSEKIWFLFLKIKCPLIETMELIIPCQVQMLNEVLLLANVTVLAGSRVFRNVINIKKGSSVLDCKIRLVSLLEAK